MVELYELVKGRFEYKNGALVITGSLHIESSQVVLPHSLVVNGSMTVIDSYVVFPTNMLVIEGDLRLARVGTTELTGNVVIRGSLISNKWNGQWKPTTVPVDKMADVI